MRGGIVNNNILANTSEYDLNTVVSKLNAAVELLEKLTPLVFDSCDLMKCRQLQILKMDLQSMTENLTDLNENGPRDPFMEVDLEDSQVEEEHDVWKEPEHGGPSEGDMMMSAEWDK